MVPPAKIINFDKTERNNDMVYDKTERNKGTDFDKTERNCD
jgi:hypothetical protein